MDACLPSGFGLTSSVLDFGVLDLVGGAFVLDTDRLVTVSQGILPALALGCCEVAGVSVVLGTLPDADIDPNDHGVGFWDFVLLAELLLTECEEKLISLSNKPLLGVGLAHGAMMRCLVEEGGEALLGRGIFVDEDRELVRRRSER